MEVQYEADLAPNDQPGLTAYDSGFPVVGMPLFKGTDTDLGLNLEPDPYVQWTELDYEIGGEPGAVNRNAYTIHGFGMPDAHDFRGDHAVIPSSFPYGAYGDVGDTDDYATQFSQGIASNSYPDMTTEESWAAVSEGF